ncbi:dual specificity protein phosphatase family protein [Phytopseudomonas flavescens]|uniref:dual specificity protein phosphatase family protein n=1 Tax=Phytopseudomonas flavescens TaxID=29435 RepID=UPI001FC9326E|nr:dual specificity protein phosphatase family protein [Pseudomonas flavescens]
MDKTFNLYRMQPYLYRSALPSAAQRGELQKLKIATVINFYQRSDADWLSDASIRQVHQPLHADRIDDADVLQALRSIRLAQARGPVLIHCKHGQNRTGMIAAMYRIVYQGWSRQQAIDEMREGGFGGRKRFEDAEDYLQQVDLPRFRAALDSGACSTSPWAYCALKEKLLDAFNG